MKGLLLPAFLIICFSCTHGLQEQEEQHTDNLGSSTDAISVISRILSENSEIKVYQPGLDCGSHFLKVELPGKTVDFDSLSSAFSYLDIQNRRNGYILSTITDRVYACNSVTVQTEFSLWKISSSFRYFISSETKSRQIYSIVHPTKKCIPNIRYNGTNCNGDSVIFQANVYIQNLERPLWLGRNQNKLLDENDFKVLIFSTGEIKDINGYTIDSLRLKKRSKYSLSNCIKTKMYNRNPSQRFALVTGLVFMDSLSLDFKSANSISYVLRQDEMMLSGYIYEIIQ